MQETAKKGQWVKIHNILLKAGERSPRVPEDTKKVPLEMWLNGFLKDAEASIGETVTIESFIGRQVKGTLVEIEPAYEHSFGKPINELLNIGPKVRKILEGSSK